MVEISKTKDLVQDISVKHLANLRKDIAKYEESVNKCNIYETNVLSEIVGSDMDYLMYANIGTTEEQKQEVKKLEKQFLNHVENLRRCTCIKKIK